MKKRKNSISAHAFVGALLGVAFDPAGGRK